MKQKWLTREILFLTIIVMLMFVLLALFKPHTYTIIYDGNGHDSGTMVDQEVKYGREFTLNQNEFERDGYIFTGWSKNIKGSAEYSDQAKVKNLTRLEKITLYAIWKIDPNAAINKDPYVIVFDGNGNDSGDMTDQTAKQGQVIPLNPNGFNRTGYTFVG